MAKGILGRGLVPLKLIFHGNPVYELDDGHMLQKASLRSEGAARTTFRKTAMSTYQSLLEAEQNHMHAIVNKAVEQRRADTHQAKLLLQQQLEDQKGVVRQRGRKVRALNPAVRRLEASRRDVWKEGDIEQQETEGTQVDDEEREAVLKKLYQKSARSAQLGLFADESKIGASK